MSVTPKDFNTENIISKIAKNEDFKKYDFEIVSGAANGVSFMTNVFLVTIKGLKRDNSNATLKICIKFPQQSEYERNVLEIPTTYQNETLIYTTLVPALNKLQDSVNMDARDRFRVPRFLDASYDDHNEFVAMDDITVEGFKKVDRMKSLDYNHLRLVIKNMANYHAAVFAFKTFDRKNYNEFVKRISSDLYYSLKDNNKYVVMVSESLKFAKSLIDQPEEIDAIDNIIDDFPKRIDYLTSQKAAEPYDVICHGDCWKSNFWFNYENEVPKDICFFDWQVIRCGSLFTDLHYMMFLCTDGEARKKYHSAAFDWYYSDLGDVLRKFGLDVADIYPRDAFKADERKFAPYALALCVSYLPFTAAVPPNVPDFAGMLSNDYDKIKNELQKSSDITKERIKEMITDYVSYGYN